jgi:hypothetical protein
MRWAGRLVPPVVALSLACAGRQVEVISERDATIHRVADEGQAFPTQRIFRVRFQDGAGTVSFRMVGWLTSSEVFRLSAMDPVGRMLWTIDLDAPRTTVLDFRSKRACTTVGPVSLPEVAMGPLSLPDFALVLVGLPPTTFERRLEGRGDRSARNEAGWHLSVEPSGDEVGAWTLWAGREPVLWYRRDSRSSILSHRDGVQFRWRETHREQLTERPVALDIPEDFVTVACHELSPSPGTIRREDLHRPSG